MLPLPGRLHRSIQITHIGRNLVLATSAEGGWDAATLRHTQSPFTGVVHRLCLSGGEWGKSETCVRIGRIPAFLGRGPLHHPTETKWRRNATFGTAIKVLLQIGRSRRINLSETTEALLSNTPVMGITHDLQKCALLYSGSHPVAKRESSQQVHFSIYRYNNPHSDCKNKRDRISNINTSTFRA